VAEGPRWKRKSVVLLEELLERRLTSSELQRIDFIDGNPLNCTLGNLLLEDLPFLPRVCPVCGESRLCHRTDKARVCRKCYGAYYLKGRRHNAHCKLTTEQVACIRALLWDYPIATGIWRSNPFYGSLTKVSRWFLVTESTIEMILRGKTWKEILPVAQTQVWKELLKQHDKLVRQSGGTLYERVSLLVRVYEDPHFAADMQKASKSPVEELSARVRDTCCANFLELFQMFKLFPSRKEWEGGNLADMRLKMLETLRSQKDKAQTNGKTKKPVKKEPRETATLAELKSMKQTIEVEKGKVKEAKTEVEHLQDLLKEKDARIKDLELNLARAHEMMEALRGTIEMLQKERMLTPEEAAEMEE
jgi:hypothetical protein